MNEREREGKRRGRVGGGKRMREREKEKGERRMGGGGIKRRKGRRRRREGGGGRRRNQTLLLLSSQCHRNQIRAYTNQCRLNPLVKSVHRNDSTSDFDPLIYQSIRSFLVK